ncbi:hypothetical protein J6590_030674 [Homalodisca vitripennis]|nr:hypothetical protein J6590_030674 [Homalodisca vitripennis]
MSQTAGIFNAVKIGGEDNSSYRVSSAFISSCTQSPGISGDLSGCAKTRGHELAGATTSKTTTTRERRKSRTGFEKRRSGVPVLVFVCGEKSFRRPAQKTLACLFKTQITRCLPAAQRFALLALLEKKLTRACKVQAQINSPCLHTQNSDKTDAGFITGKR